MTGTISQVPHYAVPLGLPTISSWSVQRFSSLKKNSSRSWGLSVANMTRLFQILYMHFESVSYKSGAQTSYRTRRVECRSQSIRCSV